MPIVNVASPINWGNSLNRGLVSRWQNLPGGQWGRGTLFRDLCRRNDGTLTNGPEWSGPLGRPGGYGALSTTAVQGGGGAAFSVPNIDTENPSTLSFWMQSLYLPNGFNIVIDEATRAMSFWIDSTGAVSFSARIPATTGVIAPVGKWTLVTITDSRNFDGDSRKILIDGQVNGSGASSAGAVFSQTFGDNPSGGGDGGGSMIAFDDVRFYNRALSVDEVHALYETSRQQYDPTLNWIRPRKYFFVDAGGGGTPAFNYLTLLGVGS